jgi:DNA replication and repair protein RecF
VLLEHLTLQAVRNYASLEFAPEPGLNVFVGANAQGKSNLLEAIAMLGTGRSFRTTRDREVIRDAQESATIAGRARTRAGTMQLACAVVLGKTGVRKRYTVNGSPVRYAGYLGRARVVTFVPHDLELVVGPPGRRRALLNAALSQARPTYYPALARYATYLAQKSAVLRAPGVPDRDLLDTYDERLATAGAELITARLEYVAALGDEARHAYDTWADDGPFEVAYAPNVDLAAAAPAARAQALAARFAATRAVEIARRAIVSGPHRDDLSFSLAGRSLSAFGSQGQQRSAVLAVKIAEYAVSTARSGEPPLLLLDDVLSELDRERQAAFLAAIAGVEQAFVTATSEPDRFGSAATFRVASATLERVA